MTSTDLGVAERLEEALRPFVGGDLPVRLKAWDGSSAGPDDAPLVELHSPDAIRRMLWHHRLLLKHIVHISESSHAVP